MKADIKKPLFAFPKFKKLLKFFFWKFSWTEELQIFRIPQNLYFGGWASDKKNIINIFSENVSRRIQKFF